MFKHTIRVAAAGVLIAGGVGYMEINMSLYVAGVLFITAEVGEALID
jgi:preprotein translocase subunit Sss1|tara:strand:- start:227 stop:367 length:141 start_codon:yes stop_codon:yes gene_type:complete